MVGQKGSTVFILTPVLSDVQMKEAVEKFKTILTEQGAVIVNEENTAIAAQLEYTEIPAFGGNIKNGSNGEELDLSSLAWFLDMNVKVTVATLAGGGYRIVSVTTI